MRKKKNLVNLDTPPVKVQRKRALVMPDAVVNNLPQIVIISVIAAAVIAFAIFVGMAMISRDLMKPGISTSSTESKELTFGESDSLTLLIAMVDDDKVNAEHFVLMRVDPAESAVYASPLPPELEVTERGATLAQRYTEGGTAQCAEDICELVGARKVYCATINYNSMIKLVDAIGGVTLAVDYDIDYRTENTARNITVARGERVFSGGEAARLLDCPEWPGGIEEQRLMYARAFAGMANGLLVTNRASSLQRYYNRIYNAVTTNVSAGVFQDIQPALYEFAFMRANAAESIAQIVLVETESDGEALSLSDNGDKVARYIYGRRE